MSLRGTPGQFRLELKDGGVGFDPAGALPQKGLGLVSMQERFHLVKGVFHNESKPTQGTSVVATVLLGVDVNAAPASSGNEVAS